MSTEKPRILSCAEMDQFVVDYLDQKLPVWTRFKFRFHLLLCPKCRDFLNGYKKTLEVERRAFAEREKDAANPAPEELVRAILAARPKTP